MTRWMGLALLAASCTSSAAAVCAAPASDDAAVAAVLDGFHAAAAASEEEKYFGLMTPDAVFLGTDATERWTRDEFRRYAHPYFAAGKGWSYRSTTRRIALSADGRVAWFDELLENAHYGTCRGSGVLVRTSEGWRIAQYNLSIPIPNDLADEFVRRIAEKGKTKARAK